MPLADAAKSMATATGVKGRVEVVPTDTDYTVLIDYAHSPDGVENVLKAVRGFAKGRVVALFGCGGDRDRTKRPKMGKIAADLADFCVVTSDNPRTEEPKAIIDDILEGMKDSDTPMQVIVDRPEAIHWALAHAQKDDIIVLMGKGHETYQEVNHVKHHMDEREMSGILRDKLQVPYLRRTVPKETALRKTWRLPAPPAGSGIKPRHVPVL
ncbi:MAG: glutamate ligase domain-containing protein [Butyricicoccus sp.]